MCGIAGIHAYHYAAPAVDVHELQLIRDHLRHRGPDSLGEWISEDGKLGFGHTRLSIIELSELGDQPMTDESGELVITYNGEIYNHKDLRKELEAIGHKFRSGSDTEVLIHLYREYGTEMLPKLRGMFAFALYDSRDEQLLLARDPYGIKPLYFSDDGWAIKFASEVRGLLASPSVDRERNDVARAGFYLLGSVPEPLTWFKSISALPAGTYMTVSKLGASAPQPYWSIAEQWCPEGESHDGLLDQLLESVDCHFESDVPVGLFLSGGIDSSAILGIANRLGQDVHAITLAFEEYRGTPEDESILASQTAELFGVRHSIRYVSEDEFLADSDAFFSSMDQPTIDGINTWFISKAAREQGIKVCLSGLGADEMFGGYPSFRYIPRIFRWSRPFSYIPGLTGLWHILSPLAFWFRPDLSRKIRGLLRYSRSTEHAFLLQRAIYLPSEIASILGEKETKQSLKQLDFHKSMSNVTDGIGFQFGRISALESSFYMRNQLLRAADWASMAHSVELRVPFVDPALMAYVGSLAAPATGQGKAHLIASLTDVLPQVILSKEKTGFQVPISNWLTRLTDNQRPGHWSRSWCHYVAQRYEAEIGSV